MEGGAEMPEQERDERVYLREFARVALEVCGPDDWPGAEALLRSVWPRRQRCLTLEEALGRIDIQGNHSGIEARYRKARKCEGLRSKRVAMRRNCLNLAKQRSMRFRRR